MKEDVLLKEMPPDLQSIYESLTDKEREALINEISSESMKKIMEWIGTDEDIEGLLFWNRGANSNGKIDGLPIPENDTVRLLWDKADRHFQRLKWNAILCQKKCDLTLHSVFNPHFLFTACLRTSQGILFRLIGSVDEFENWITVLPTGDTEFEVMLGKIDMPGIVVNTRDAHSAFQLAQLATRGLKKLEMICETRNSRGDHIEMDAKAIRKAASLTDLGLEKEMRLCGSKKVADWEAALMLADSIAATWYERFGLEVEYFNMGKKFGNVHLLRNENFEDLMSASQEKDRKGLVIITSTLVCRRCRREIPKVYQLAQSFPQIDFALAQLAAPIMSFKSRVFMQDIGGGSMEGFNKNAKGITPFIIAYKPGEDGSMKFEGYLSTEKDDDIPSYDEVTGFLNSRFA